MRMPNPAVGVALALLAAAPGRADAPSRRAVSSPHAEVGKPAPKLEFARWIGARPLTLASLRGKVVLVRWWTEGCPYCATTLPVLEELSRRHAREDLVVIGAFHPKPPRRVSDREILGAARRLGFTGPIAVDERWTTLERWLGRRASDWTSVSFLVDRGGVVRWIHPGGEYHPSEDPEHAACDRAHAELTRTLERLLSPAGPG